MREQENAYKGVFFRDERVYVRIREKGGKIGPKQEKGVFFPKYGRKTREKGLFC